MPAVRHFLDAIKFEHTVFALPFAYVAMVLAADGWPGGRVLIWVTLAMVGARTLAMSVNRVADRFIDAANPRTARRHLPTGLLTSLQVTAAALLSGALLLVFYAIPAWAKRVKAFPSESEAVVVRVVGEQFALQASFAGTQSSHVNIGTLPIVFFGKSITCPMDAFTI